MTTNMPDNISLIAPVETAKCLGASFEKCSSRSLMLDKFANPQLEHDERKKFFKKLLNKETKKEKLYQWFKIILSLSNNNKASIIYVQLQSRLMVNMAGGVMENAGLCIDRFGVPYIPGSAVKGCARRTALAALKEWTSSNSKPSKNDIFGDLCEKFSTPDEMLLYIVLTFGWSDADWLENKEKDKPSRSDLLWACGEDKYREILGIVANKLFDRFNWKKPKKDGLLWKHLDNFAGYVSFMPAYPVDLENINGLPNIVPEFGKLELDVITCHHKKYYSGDNYPVAYDTENPIPVIFPAVAPGHIFAFTLIKQRDCPDDIISLAKIWLRGGLRIFGLGAKTNSGYGWFLCSDELQNKVIDSINKKLEEERIKEAQEKKKREEQERKAREKVEEERKKREKEEQKILESLSPVEREKYLLRKMNEDAFKNELLKFKELTNERKEAIYLLLRDEKKEIWLQIREFSEKGKQKDRARWTPIVQEIFKIAKSKKEKML